MFTPEILSSKPSGCDYAVPFNVDSNDNLDDYLYKTPTNKVVVFAVNYFYNLGKILHQKLAL